MSDAWYAAFALLLLLCLANTVVLVGVLRQVGMLHQRVRPIGPGSLDGPSPGTEVPQLSLDAVTAHPENLPFSKPITLVGYVRPGCGVCETLPGFFRAFMKGKAADFEATAVLATDSGPVEAAALSNHLGLDSELPLFRSGDLRESYEIPGSPYVLALRSRDDGGATVLAAGVVNELEQLEILVDRALEYRSKPPAPNGRRLASAPSGFDLRVVPRSAAAAAANAEQQP